MLTGGGSSLKEVKQLFSFQTGFDVHIGTPGQHLGRGQVDEVRKPLYATAIGLVMKVLKSNIFMEVSMLPINWRKFIIKIMKPPPQNWKKSLPMHNHKKSRKDPLGEVLTISTCSQIC